MSEARKHNSSSCKRGEDCDKTFGKGSLSLSDVVCPICMSVLIEPVRMPCSHILCMPCFKFNVAKTALACPFCRKRISVWVRRASKSNTLIDKPLWKMIKKKFRKKVQCRLKGQDDSDDENSFCTSPLHNICEPGEIRKEYEQELQRVHLELEQEKDNEEAASTETIKRLEEEERGLQIKLRVEMDRSCQGDIVMAQQLQKDELDAMHRRTPKKKMGPMDFYVGQMTPGTHSKKLSKRCEVSASSLTSGVTARNMLDSFVSQSQSSPEICPVLQHPLSSRHLQDITSSCGSESGVTARNMLDSFVSQSQSSPEICPILQHPLSSRHLQDITSLCGSESESEDPAERPKTDRRKRLGKENRREQLNGVVDEASHKGHFEVDSLRGFGRSSALTEQDSSSHIDTQQYVDFLSGNCADELHHTQFIEEQKKIEALIRQEKEDHFLAVRLQKELKMIDRRKGSADEYSLRRNKRKSVARCCPVGDACSSTLQSKSKARQTTIIEHLSKRARRI